MVSCGIGLCSYIIDLSESPHYLRAHDLGDIFADDVRDALRCSGNAYPNAGFAFHVLMKYVDRPGFYRNRSGCVDQKRDFPHRLSWIGQSCVGD